MRRRPSGRPGLRPSPGSAAPGRSGLETKAGRAPRSTHQFFRTRGAVMSLRRDPHAPKCPHGRLIDASAPSAMGHQCCGGER
jgi:hypothetical protein